jgi:tetratricopeptide (TPR) repeat protein
LSYAGPEEGEIREALESILRQPEFQSSPRLSSFLRFVVEETLDGRGSRLKAFTIATSVFGRDEGFDPQTNPIVRVEALRLRRMLDQYYSGTGAADPVEIRIRRGSYVPEFAHRARGAPSGETATNATVPSLDSTPRRIAIWRGAAIAAGLALLVGAGVLWNVTDRAPATHQLFGTSTARQTFQPTIRVGPFNAGNDANLTALAGILESRIEDTISRFDGPLVLHDPTGKPDSDYQITANLGLEAGGTAEISFRMIHVPTREIVWTRLLNGIPADPATARADGMIGSIAASVAQTYGAVYSDMRKRLPKNPADVSGYGCVMLAYGALNTPAKSSRADADACLERAVAENPNFASGFATLSLLSTFQYLAGETREDGVSPIDRASELANRAVSLSPQKVRPHTAQFTARFYGGRFDDAFESAQTAMDINPYAADTIARIGAAHLLRGETELGRTLIARALQSNAVPPGWLEFFIWLDAWQQGDLATAHRHARRSSSSQFPLGMVARIITWSEKGEAATAQRWIERLGTTYPGFAADIPAALQRYGMVPELSDKLLGALDKAGLPRQQAMSR